MRDKRGIFFSIDALIAVSLILLVVFLANPIDRSIEFESRLPDDILTSLSAIKMGDLVTSGTGSGILAGHPDITGTMLPDKTVLEQLGIYTITNITLAKTLANVVLADINTTENMGIWYGDEIIWISDNRTAFDDAEDVLVDRRIISGFGNDTGSAFGYAARAFLTDAHKTKYYYFGGYVGDGNITANFSIPGDVTGASMELTINEDFDLYINGNDVGSFSASPSDTQPATYSLIDSGLEYFLNDSVNVIEFKSEFPLYISGGYIKVSYESDDIEDYSLQHLTGVKGLFNIYEGLYFPDDFEGLDVNLLVDTNNQTAFISIADTVIMTFQTDGLEPVPIPSMFIEGELSGGYGPLKGKTVPIRIGLSNVSFVVNATLDIISVFDITASMEPYKEPLENAHIIILDETVLKFPSLARMGFVGYRAASVSYNNPLSNDYNLLYSRLTEDKTFSSQQRSLCNGIQWSVAEFQNNPGEGEVFKVGILMGAGVLSDQQCTGVGADVYEKTIDVACSAALSDNITFYTAGFGTHQPTLDAMQEIADCSGGEYFEGDISELEELYSEIVKELLRRYQLQTIFANETFTTELSSESYLLFDYPSGSSPPGLVVNAESKFFNSTTGSFSVPADSQFIEARVTSYSGPRWTDRGSINGVNFFNLSEYGDNYVEVGDPFSVVIDPDLVNKTGGTNVVNLFAASSPEVYYPGSEFNKIIYRLARNVSSLSPISLLADGCEWEIKFEDGTNITGLAVPTDYTGGKVCEYSLPEPTEDYSPNDAYHVAMFDLLSQLDFDSDGMIDVVFTAQDLQVALSELTGIPMTYQTEIQARVWR